MAQNTVRFIVRRQADLQSDPYWEEFDIRYRPGMNVITGLMDIAADPVDRFGKRTTPVAYEANLLLPVPGGLPAVYAADRLRWSGHHQSGAVV